jgi:biopolymer transport protein ExbB
MSLWTLFEHGGPVMWPLVAASILALALILDRAAAFAWWHQSFRGVIDELRPLVLERAWAEAERRCNHRGPLTSLAGVYLRLRDEPKEIREDILRREGVLILGVLERRLRGLALLAQVGTLLGLLGTFYFMIYRFNPEATAGGVLGQAEFYTAIWESFLSTMFGLAIAIPCTVAYHLFDGRAEGLSREMGLLVSYLDEWRRLAERHPEECAEVDEMAADPSRASA